MLNQLDFARWIRYWIPGGVFELALGSWLFFDSASCQCYGTIEISATEVMLVAAGAALPIGFLASVLGHELYWRRVLRRLDDAWASEPVEFVSYIPALEPPLPDSSPRRARIGRIVVNLIGSRLPDEERAAAEIDLIIRLLKNREKSVARLDSLVDNMRGLAASFAAVLAAAFSSLILLLVALVAHWDLGVYFADAERVAILVAWLAICAVTAFLLWIGQRKVCRIAEYYARSLLSRSHTMLC